MKTQVESYQSLEYLDLNNSHTDTGLNKNMRLDGGVKYESVTCTRMK